MTSLIPVHFAHGNGFPSESYQELFDHLSPWCQVEYIPMVGHGEYQVTNNWADLAAEVLVNIHKHHKEPIVGIGHSLGGVLMYMAACQEPQAFREIILLDSPMPGFWRSWLLKFAKKLNLMPQFMPIERTKTRRLYFETREDAYQYFRKKPLFKQFTPRSLELYVEYGLTEVESGFTLRFDRDTELRIYQTVPDNLYKYDKPSGLKVSLIYSVYSEMTKPELIAMRDHYGIELYPFHRGTHLFPFEYPEATAKMIKTIILKDSES